MDVLKHLQLKVLEPDYKLIIAIILKINFFIILIYINKETKPEVNLFLFDSIWELLELH